MKLRSVFPMRLAKYGYIVLSAVFCAAGLALLLLPAPPEAVVGRFFGIAMILFGAIKLIGYFSKDLFRLAFQYDLQLGLLLSLLGIVTLIKYDTAAAFVCVAFGVWLLADCLFKIRIAFDAKRFGIRQWWLTLTLTLAILSGVAGILTMLCPSAALKVIDTMLGCALLCAGALNLSVAISMIKIVRHQKSDTIVLDESEIWEET